MNNNERLEVTFQEMASGIYWVNYIKVGYTKIESHESLDFALGAYVGADAVVQLLNRPEVNVIVEKRDGNINWEEKHGRKYN